jgi:hypothetical protein
MKARVTRIEPQHADAWVAGKHMLPPVPTPWWREPISAVAVSAVVFGIIAVIALVGAIR